MASKKSMSEATSKKAEFPNEPLIILCHVCNITDMTNVIQVRVVGCNEFTWRPLCHKCTMTTCENCLYSCKICDNQDNDKTERGSTMDKYAIYCKKCLDKMMD